MRGGASMQDGADVNHRVLALTSVTQHTLLYFAELLICGPAVCIFAPAGRRRNTLDVSALAAGSPDGQGEGSRDGRDFMFEFFDF